MSQPDLRCYYHPEREAAGQCDRCGDLLCSDCVHHWRRQELCRRCLDDLTPSPDPSVFSEPHIGGDGFRADPSEARADGTLQRARDGQTADEQREHSVWDEPTLSPELAGALPAGDATYGTWLETRRNQTSAALTWLITIGVALLAGPWAMLGALWGSGQTSFSVLAIVVFAPVVEEIAKVATALHVVEKKPFLFRSPAQIALCAIAGGLAFASIENLLYQYVYLRDALPGLIRWRWTVCVAMHTTCSFICGLGLIRIWRDTWARRARPRLALSFPYAATAMIIHGAYNAFAVFLSAIQYRF